jgi:hypothetical protein
MRETVRGCPHYGKTGPALWQDRIICVFKMAFHSDWSNAKSYGSGSNCHQSRLTTGVLLPKNLIYRS